MKSICIRKVGYQKGAPDLRATAKRLNPELDVSPMDNPAAKFPTVDYVDLVFPGPDGLMSIIKTAWVLPIAAQTALTGTLADFLRTLGATVTEVDLDAEDGDSDEEDERDGNALHNGELSGGGAPAAGRPWRILLVVRGFSSKSDALAFEWAWQKPHTSRHIARQWGVKGFGKCGTRSKVSVRLAALALLLVHGHWAACALHVLFKFKSDIEYSSHSLGALSEISAITAAKGVPAAFGLVLTNATTSEGAPLC
ncbi:hypothetical protein EMIHUDRAFT_223118 [Emiliania huxleyi CCMP1516]|uniref:Uncharacterized protein n=2 Tax=Emiliania huxleyi TaxID=2903 RepID=A0A0D3KVZ9_EMIH1|nr:hypothetical protein EMIHUDRAFT_223118 [Emiliania huxleyi CCMP1516]EOD39934.1 hypothetical protein EMIHUDRAFT_223118 [Emiliania huxleyi CCMP1516]|eukprot:XP_005792363.1 hypothetical protein EMIHUDRAFT_223118 [Emiliania huxleyi CCMP1516]